LWSLTLYRLDVMGTDVSDATEFAARAVPGAMNLGTGTFRDAYAKSSLADPSKPNLGFDIAGALQFATTKVMNWWFTSNRDKMQEWVNSGVFTSIEEGECTMEGNRPNNFRAPLAYPARPMAGYWATAPFLHNHSIPNLYELLSPVAERSKTFYVGNPEFDPINVGYEAGMFQGGFKFKTNEPGNSNAGHEFSAKPGDPAKPGVIGPSLTPEDRMAIVEYMKAIADVPPLSEKEAVRRQTLLEKMRPYFEEKVAGTGTFGDVAPTYAPATGQPAAGKK